MNLNNLNPAKFAQIARKGSDGVSELLLKEDENGISKAEIVADAVNVMRLDTALLARAVGVEVETEQMTPDEAADLLAGVATGSGAELVDVFDNEEEKREEILREILSDERVDEFVKSKRQQLYTAQKLGKVDAPDDSENDG